MSFHPDWFGRAPIGSTLNAEQSEFESARAIILDELALAVVDRHGRRIKEKNVRVAIKQVSEL